MNLCVCLRMRYVVDSSFHYAAFIMTWVWPRSLSPWLPSDPDEVSGALPTVRPYGDLVYLETGSSEAFGESTVGTRRPHAEPTVALWPSMYLVVL